ncbi:uncharacterized protein LOC124313447 isoform X1 [Daphnia pulicaria]|uniref:uncharacterized protein LOC124313447 isoform X1 n=1 Tax=Daphnia pulicaria TaxID=35523 RepID=UPI001EEC6C00|nr:uncharacterized protein LOC124313447 isoform X1 [Daphnia pulicaria]
MKFKVFIILAMVALVFVFTVTANPAPEEHVSEMVKKSEHASKDHHASEDHHAAAGKSAAAHSRHVKRVRDGKKHREPIGRRPREVKAATKEHKKGAIATKEATPTKTGVPIKAGATAPIHVPEGAPAVGLHAPLRVKPRQPKVIWNAPKKPVAG